MYFVNEKPFTDLLDAIAHCKSSPTNTLTDSKGTVLMHHVVLPYEEFRDIQVAKKILQIQMSL